MINGQILKQAVISGANNISNQKNSINDLNIFPVPDGDTGTNMSMTVNAAVAALEDFDGRRHHSLCNAPWSKRQFGCYHFTNLPWLCPGT